MQSATKVKTESRPGRYTDGRRGNGLSLLVKLAADGGVRKVCTQRVQVDGRRRNLGLGRYPLVKLSEAREMALSNARDAWRGVDPLKRNAGRRAFRRSHRPLSSSTRRDGARAGATPTCGVSGSVTNATRSPR